MKLYMAGFYASNFDKNGTVYRRLSPPERAARDSIRHNLESYHYIAKGQAITKLRRDSVKVFLDSGAFSSMTKGVHVDLKGYCDYIKKNEDIIERVDGVLMASVLDSIGSVEKTWENQAEMEKHGVTPLPCFHYGEDEDALKYYVSEYPYITLGGMVPISTPQLIHWLDRIFEKYLCDKDGVMKTKVHGFGLTSLPLMKRYPWTSVDSSTWVMWSANGMILMPGVGEAGEARQINVSEFSSSKKSEGRHYDTVTDIERERLRGLIEATGFEVERLRKEYSTRWAWNAWAFQLEGEKSIKTTFTRHQPELF